MTRQLVQPGSDDLDYFWLASPHFITIYASPAHLLLSSVTFPFCVWFPGTLTFCAMSFHTMRSNASICFTKIKSTLLLPWMNSFDLIVIIQSRIFNYSINMMFCWFVFGLFLAKSWRSPADRQIVSPPYKSILLQLLFCLSQFIPHSINCTPLDIFKSCPPASTFFTTFQAGSPARLGLQTLGKVSHQLQHWSCYLVVQQLTDSPHSSSAFQLQGHWF